MGYLDTSPLFNIFLKSHKEVPKIAKLGNITQISLWFMVDIPILSYILNGAYKPTFTSCLGAPHVNYIPLINTSSPT